MPTETFTAGDDFVVPNGVFELTVELEGEAARELSNSQFDTYGDSGDGGRVAGVLDVTPGETLYIRRSPGGNSPGGQDGGDSVDIRRGGTGLSDRVAVAAGGGGGGNFQDSFEFFSAPGGDGGASTGENGGGQGGTQNAGGAGDTDSFDGDDGAFGPGGDGGSGTNGAASGGGGAGWYGGGGGASQQNTQGPAEATAGGGGSNYDDGLTTVSANERGTSSRSYSQGGLVTIEYTLARVKNLQTTSVDPTSIGLSWDPPTLPDVATLNGYQIYRDTDAGTDRADYSQIATVDEGVTTFLDTGLNNGVEYHYRVGATFFIPEVDVNTLSVTGVTETEAQLNGELAQLVDAPSADVGFEFRETGATSFTSTPTTALSSPQTYDDLASGLNSGTEYEARAVADANGVTASGALVSWTTKTAIPDSETWQDYTVGQFPPSPYIEVDTAGGQLIDDARSIGSSDRSFHVDGNHGDVDDTFDPLARSTFDARQQETLEVHYNETSNSQGQAWRWLDDTGDEICAVVADNPQVYIYSGGGSTAVESSPSPSYNEWRRFEVTIDWSAGTFSVLWEDLTGGTGDRTVSGLSFVDNPQNVAQWEMGNDKRGAPVNNTTTDCWVGPTTSV